MFPVGGPDPTAETMNYTCVINMAVWGGAVGYYAIDARKWFKGPVVTVDVTQLSAEQEEVLRHQQGLQLEGEAGRKASRGSVEKTA